MLQRFLDRFRSPYAVYARRCGELKTQLSDIQGLLLKGYAELTHAAFLLLKINDPEAFRSWLNAVWPEIATAQTQGPRRMNLAFTASGLRKLGLGEEVLGTFSREFREGMSHRRQQLGDEDSPSGWEFGDDDTTLHVMLMLYAQGETEIEALLARHQRHLRAADIQVILTQRASRLQEPDNGQSPKPQPIREHFGFKDGLSQPILAGFQEHLRRRVHALDEPVLPGEFILGYPNEYQELPASPCIPAAADPRGYLREVPGQPGWRDFGHNGTYLVLRKLQQNKKNFRKFLDRAARAEPDLAPAPDVRRCPMARLGALVQRFLPDKSRQERAEARRALLAAKLVGRAQDGAPLEPEGKSSSNPPESWMYRFSYRDRDPEGMGCPIAAHIRRANPRDALPLGGVVFPRRSKGEDSLRRISFSVVRKHRIIRRGITYRDAEGREGLLFLALNANIRRQFEFVQQLWLGGDLFTGAPPSGAPLTIPGDALRTRLQGASPLVEVRGGAYFFLPSLTALRFLAEQLPSPGSVTPDRR